MSSQKHKIPKYADIVNEKKEKMTFTFTIKLKETPKNWPKNWKLPPGELIEQEISFSVDPKEENSPIFIHSLENYAQEFLRKYIEVVYKKNE